MDEKKKLIERIRRVNGRDPKTVNEFLDVLAHEDVIAHAKAYLQAKDTTDACQKYQAPWNCAREAEAYSQVVHNGAWSGGMNEIIQNWCVNCQARLYGDDPGDISDEITLSWLEDPTEKLPVGKRITGELENPMISRDVDGCD